MFTEDNVNEALEWILEKVRETANPTHHSITAGNTQEDIDHHFDALAHHSGAIEHYRNQPEVKKHLETISKLIPHRGYIKKPIKLLNKKAPVISLDDLDSSHPILSGMSDEEKQSHVEKLNTALKAAHALAQTPAIQALKEHGDRFHAHLARLVQWHNNQKEGAGVNHNFIARMEGPELTGNQRNSKYRAHSKAGAGDYRTNAITKLSGWDPGLPEMSSLEEHAEHGDAGKSKELFPFREVKLNGQALEPKTFESAPDTIHHKDSATELSSDHMVTFPNSPDKKEKALGPWHPSKAVDLATAGAEKGLLKSEDFSSISDDFPNVTNAHFVFAQNMIEQINPFSHLEDEDFADFAKDRLNKATTSEQALIIMEASDRLEKAKKEPRTKKLSNKDLESHWKQGVRDVLSGKTTPAVHANDEQEPNKSAQNEVKDIEKLQGSGFTRKRNPYVVPSSVFMDDTHSKIDPEKYKKWINEDATHDDIKNEHATYQEMIRQNPKAAERHKKYRDMEQDHIKSALQQLSGSEDEEAPKGPDHKSMIAAANEKLKSSEKKPQDFIEHAKAMQEAHAVKSGAVTKLKASTEDTPEESQIRAIDPSYKPRKEGSTRKKGADYEEQLTALATGKKLAPKSATAASTDEISDKGDGQDDADARSFTADNEFAQKQAQVSAEDLASEAVGHKAAGDEDSKTKAEIQLAPDPITFLSQHPGYNKYLQLKDTLTSHFTDPHVKKYMQDKLSEVENNPDATPEQHARILAFMHASANTAKKHAQAGENLTTKEAPPEVVGAEPGDDATGGSFVHPEGSMTPEQQKRFKEVKDTKAKIVAEQAAPTSQHLDGVTKELTDLAGKAPTTQTEAAQPAKAKAVIRRPKAQ